MINFLVKMGLAFFGVYACILIAEISLALIMIMVELMNGLLDLTHKVIDSIFYYLLNLFTFYKLKVKSFFARLCR